MRLAFNVTCRYLRDGVTKHHIDALYGHESVLRSCLSYIIGARVFLDENASYSLINEIAKTSHGIHRYAWKYWTTHLSKYVQLIIETGVQFNGSIIDQLRSLLWLHKKRPNVTPVAIDGLHPSLSVFRDMPDIAALLSEIFIFQETVSSVEQKIQDPKSMSSYNTLRLLHFLSHIFGLRVFTLIAIQNQMLLMIVQCYNLNLPVATPPGLVRLTRDMRITLKYY